MKNKGECQQGVSSMIACHGGAATLEAREAKVLLCDEGLTTEWRWKRTCRVVAAKKRVEVSND